MANEGTNTGLHDAMSPLILQNYIGMASAKNNYIQRHISQPVDGRRGQKEEPCQTAAAKDLPSHQLGAPCYQTEQYIHWQV